MGGVQISKLSVSFGTKTAPYLQNSKNRNMHRGKHAKTSLVKNKGKIKKIQTRTGIPNKTNLLLEKNSVGKFRRNMKRVNKMRKTLAKPLFLYLESPCMMRQAVPRSSYTYLNISSKLAIARQFNAIITLVIITVTFPPT